jgi:hypothetical protein
VTIDPPAQPSDISSSKAYPKYLKEDILISIGGIEYLFFSPFSIISLDKAFYHIDV